MAYCIHCGDPIEPGEYYRCDKCGCLFNVIEGPRGGGADVRMPNSTYRQATVYMQVNPGAGAQVQGRALALNGKPTIQA